MQGYLNHNFDKPFSNEQNSDSEGFFWDFSIWIDSLGST